MKAKVQFSKMRETFYLHTMHFNPQPGKFHVLKVQRIVNFGVYLEGGEQGILLPKRYVSPQVKLGDELKVFLYHDGEDRLIATTDVPYAQLEEIALLTVISTNPQGAFMNWGLMKDLFVPKSQQINRMIPQGKYMVKIKQDVKTGRLYGTEKWEHEISNENLTLQEKEQVEMMIHRRTDLGYAVVINHKHHGLLYHEEIFQSIYPGARFSGFIKKIYPENNQIDAAIGKPGYQRVDDQSAIILKLLEDNGGFLPYHDKSDPEQIYEVFQMSKKTFKMCLGNLYKLRLIEIGPTGIKLI
jgi:predicted RNA-binding protein (virulence factor B family)